VKGQPERSGSIRRVPAVEIETLVIRSVQWHLRLNDSNEVREFLTDHIERAEIRPDHLVIQLSQTQTQPDRGRRAQRYSTSSGRKPNRRVVVRYYYRLPPCPKIPVRFVLRPADPRLIYRPRTPLA